MPYKPPYRALWEITRRCDLRCGHCLVDGGLASSDELTTEEALDLVDQMAELGIRAISLTGGEPLLRKDWPKIGGRIRERDIILRWSMNGHFLDNSVTKTLLALGTEHVAVSIDGLKKTHDRLRLGPNNDRKQQSSFDRVLRAIDLLHSTSILTTVITAVTQENLEELPVLHRVLKKHGVQIWMVQLAHRTGRLSRENISAGSGPPRPLLPEHLPELADFLVRAARDPDLPPRLHNSIGYLSEEEPILRQSGQPQRALFWRGCACGKRSIGIEPDGGIKGCANQVGAPFVVGNIREEPLKAIWQDRARWHWLDPDPSRMTGYCAECKLNKICSAGCTALAWGATGELFNNPYCLRAVRKSRGTH
ncbi:MAG: radical SAM protein [Proteobacteria bacterium]|nr:radical SAM protein [Pseudomonadota bacterium]